MQVSLVCLSSTRTGETGAVSHPTCFQEVVGVTKRVLVVAVVLVLVAGTAALMQAKTDALAAGGALVGGGW